MTSVLGPFGPGLRRGLEEKRSWYFFRTKVAWIRNSVEGRTAMAARHSSALQQLAPEGEEESLDRREVWSAFSGSIEHQQLLLKQEVFGDD